MENKQVIDVKLAIRNAALKKQLQQTVRTMNDYLLMDPDDHQPCDLLILELGHPTKEEIQRIQTIISQGKAREIFLVAPAPDANLLMQAMRLGIKEFFPLPLNEVDLDKALRRFAARSRRPEPSHPGRSGQVISIVGGKGGVGATTVAVNLAVSLRQSHSDASVALLDMNTLFGEIPLFMEIEPQFHWGDLTKNINRLDETFLMNLLSRHPTGVQVLPSPGYLNGHQRPTPQIMQQLLALMQSIFDHVVIDCGQATHDTALKTFALSTHLLLIATPSLPCLANTNKLLRSVVELGFVEEEKSKVILNRYIKRGDISAKDAREGLGQEVFWKIPNDYVTTMAAINQGRPLNAVAPRSKIARNFDALAQALRPEENKPVKKGWRLFGG
ncbi:MAG: P-loop NTPase [Desulfobacteraceae bacterium]